MFRSKSARVWQVEDLPGERTIAVFQNSNPHLARKDLSLNALLEEYRSPGRRFLDLHYLAPGCSIQKLRRFRPESGRRQSAHSSHRGERRRYAHWWGRTTAAARPTEVDAALQSAWAKHCGHRQLPDRLDQGLWRYRGRIGHARHFQDAIPGWLDQQAGGGDRRALLGGTGQALARREC